MPIRSSVSCFATLVALIATLVAAHAQNPPTRIRGTISAIDGKTATIAARDGSNVVLQLADNWGVLVVRPAAASDLKENAFVGIGSLKAADGVQEALEVLIFPEAARGSNEGHYPWDLQPESMMTNATVSTVASASDGKTLTLKYAGGNQTIRLKPGIPIVTFEPGDRANAKPGAKVFVSATRASDGSLRATRLLVGKDGLTPPM